ncbi:HNH endonuclease [Streptomyces lunaelactis]|uniref:HNH endonuclease n=1 Tax=Streptomyces lunaelactis TaxID=1535768 RepID=UPI00158485D5|nr:HNH endonuclease [Streptomyces lunaelactis]NUK72110.1 HNH endonuclease [Streptomyces lunaelactis]NUK80018.1 HNH endonuclease [Streptomyces lunaelactis]
MPGGWKNSTRRSRLPPNWRALRAAAHRRNPGHLCHICGRPGGDALDHKQAGDNHSLDNLDWAHDQMPPYCHRYKSAAEGNAARPSARRPPERHPGLLDPPTERN